MLFIFIFIFETGSYCVALAVWEFTMYIRMALNSQKFSSLFFQRTGIKDTHTHTHTMQIFAVMLCRVKTEVLNLESTSTSPGGNLNIS
jgi:hypothetical protein